MKVVVRQVSPVDVRQELLDLLQRNLDVNQEAGFEWCYAMNPVGPAWCWFAYADSRSAAVAMASVVPRHMYVDRTLTTCGQVTHFVIDAAYRSLGPALQLQRATFEPVDSGALAFCYDCPPHDRGMSTFVRLGMRASCEVARYALVLRSDEYLSRKLGKGKVTRPLVATANLFLRMRGSASPVPGLEIGEHAGALGEEFSCLDRQVSSSGKVRASRSAENLTWRYRENPGASVRPPDSDKGEYHILVARRAGELLAFVVVFLVRADGVGFIADLFGSQISDVGAPLLEAAISICRKENLHALYGFCSEKSDLHALFKSAGFRRRERIARVVAYENPQSQAGRVLNPGLRWAFGQYEVML
jgi:hypothetical protein